MKIQSIPVNKCVVPEVRVTASYDEETQKLLTSTIDAMGQIQPIVVVSDGEKYIVTDGKHRLEEAIRKGQEKIDAVVYTGDEKSALLQNLVLNRVRGKTKASELVTVMKSLFNDYGLDIEGIQKETGYSRDQIERYIKVSEASPLVQELLDQEIIGIGVAYELSRLPNYEQQDYFAAETRVWAYSVKDLKAKVDEVLTYIHNPGETPPPPPPPPPREFRCQVCNDTHPLDQLKPVTMCPDCYSATYRYSRDRKNVLEAAEQTKTK